MISLQALAKLHRLAALTSDPNRAYLALKNPLKTKLKLQKKLTVWNLLRKLNVESVGTNEIEALAKKNIFGHEAGQQGRSVQVEREVRRILEKRKLKISEEVNSMRSRVSREDKELRMEMRTIWAPVYLASFYRRVEVAEAGRVWRERGELYSSRATWLVKKYQPEGRTEQDERLRGVRVRDQDVLKKKREAKVIKQDN